MLSLVGLGTAVTSFSVGAVVSIVKEGTDWVIGLLALSVTVMVQLSWVPSAMALKVTVVILSASVVVLLSILLLQLPPYVMAPASVE